MWEWWTPCTHLATCTALLYLFLSHQVVAAHNRSSLPPPPPYPPRPTCHPSPPQHGSGRLPPRRSPTPPQPTRLAAASLPLLMARPWGGTTQSFPKRAAWAAPHHELPAPGCQPQPRHPHVPLRRSLTTKVRPEKGGDGRCLLCHAMQPHGEERSRKGTDEAERGTAIRIIHNVRKLHMNRSKFASDR